jgi:hypothetical protein
MISSDEQIAAGRMTSHSSTSQDVRMTRAELAEAIAQQEEHILRNRSCLGQLGRPHRWERYGVPATRESYEACVVCQVPRVARPGAVARGLVEARR